MTANLRQDYQLFNTCASFGQTNSEREVARTHNSTYPKGGVSCSTGSFVVNQTLVFQIKFCGKSPALRVAAKRYRAL